MKTIKKDKALFKIKQGFVTHAILPACFITYTLKQNRYTKVKCISHDMCFVQNIR